MSLFNYFSPVSKDSSNSSALQMIRASIDNASMDVVNEAASILTASLSEHEIIHVAENIEIAETVSRAQYKDSEKCKIAKYASEHGVMKAVKKFKKDFLKLTESTVRPWVKKYKPEPLAATTVFST